MESRPRPPRRHARRHQEVLPRGGQEPQAVRHGALSWRRPRNDRRCPLGVRGRLKRGGAVHHRFPKGF
ncbi:unnamed protein product [Ectocarpus sp. 13 AM-2016]